MELTHGERRSIDGGLTMEGHVQPLSRTVKEHFFNILGRMDGSNRTTYSIWKLPEAGGDPRKMGETFIQAAGSADKLAIEARVIASDGSSRLHAVGRQEPHNDVTTTVPINDKRAVRVFMNEIFTADEAAEMFLTFYLTDSVDSSYRLREIDLDVAQSEER